MSRRPLPAALRNLRGKSHHKKRPIGKPARAEIGNPGIPMSLMGDGVAIECWKRTSRHLVKMKVLAKADGLALEGMCKAYSRAVEADAECEKHGITFPNPMGGRSANPAVGISKSSWAEVRKFAAEFGLTPSSRSRVQEIPEDQRESGTAKAKETAEDFLFNSAKVVGSIGGR